MYYFFYILLLLTSPLSWSSDRTDFTDDELKQVIGKSAVEIVDDIDNNWDPNPRHLKYLSAPDHIPWHNANDASQEAEKDPRYQYLMKIGLITAEIARQSAYEITYTHNFLVYHSQPVINEIERRLSYISIPDDNLIFPEQFPHGCHTSSIFMAAIGSSPQLI